MTEGAIVTLVSAILVAIVGGFFTLLVRRSRESVSMTSAWDRIDKLQGDLDVVRVAVRIGEEGFDAMWSWGRRVRDDWGRTEHPPQFSQDEERAIRRARQSVEIATTTAEVTIPKVRSRG